MQYVYQDCKFDKKKNAYAWYDVPGEVLKLYIYLAGPCYNDDQLQSDFANLEENFVDHLKAYVSMFSQKTLKQ